MNYSKEELTDYNGERGYWRTINGRKIFISIEDTKEERESKIKNFVERKKSNSENKIQNSVDEADKEFNKKRDSAKQRYDELKSKYKESTNTDEKNKIKEEMDSLNLFHDFEDKKKPVPIERKEVVKKKAVLKEKTEEPKEDAFDRKDVNDPYVKFGLEKDEEFLKERNFNNENDKEKFYRAKEIEHNINYLKVRGIVVKGDKLFNERTGEYLDEEKTNEMKLNARKRTKEIIEKEMSDYDKIKASLNSGEYKNRLKGSIKKYYEKKGKKYKDDSLIQNADYLTDKYLDEETRKLKRWIK